ncbi:hypothetical protein Pfo_015082 [Paulownia fortunei]|nr:hypothetical protein Pfo_015082 [Paulownia fortunei]
MEAESNWVLFVPKKRRHRCPSRQPPRVWRRATAALQRESNGGRHFHEGRRRFSRKGGGGDEKNEYLERCSGDSDDKISNLMRRLHSPKIPHYYPKKKNRTGKNPSDG